MGVTVDFTRLNVTPITKVLSLWSIVSLKEWDRYSGMLMESSSSKVTITNASELYKISVSVKFWVSQRRLTVIGITKLASTYTIQFLTRKAQKQLSTKLLAKRSRNRVYDIYALHIPNLHTSEFPHLTSTFIPTLSKANLFGTMLNEFPRSTTWVASWDPRAIRLLIRDKCANG